jgi:flavin reductase (DIM6/NTAB) family NADH-FMN oxidoreductase RutF
MMVSTPVHVVLKQKVFSTGHSIAAAAADDDDGAAAAIWCCDRPVSKHLQPLLVMSQGRNDDTAAVFPENMVAAVSLPSDSSPSAASSQHPS